MKTLLLSEGLWNIVNKGFKKPADEIKLTEKETASGRYICAAVNTSVPEVAEFLSKRYPHFGDFPTKAKVALSSEKLISEGFSFKYGIEETYDQTVEYLKTKGVLK
ncbi:hypothetical protein JRO89_XS06G0092300 [Xanthoceras sorbifolium]|uniref:Anthocyanidin reductase n=1 Tax=Xanthoceras sorbifolium TaxID=99658 RepID=A0ABQ8HXE4_9ROSI|nr:hypothetical protein JRO89_XS06G0092300 [Xanthoceras sorbifolium]